MIFGYARVATDAYSPESLELRVQPFQLHARVCGCELPVCFGVVLVAVILPCADLMTNVDGRHCPASSDCCPLSLGLLSALRRTAVRNQSDSLSAFVEMRKLG